MKNKVAFAIVFFLVVGVTQARQDTLSDSIQEVVRSLPEDDRLTFLKEKMHENEPNSSRLIYARLLYNEATDKKNSPLIADAIFMMVRHFYAMDSDSMRYWMKQGEPLFFHLRRYEELSRMKAWDIYKLNTEGKKIEVLEAVERLRKLSDEIGYPEGREMADQAMADFYFSNELPQDAEKLYLQVLDQMEKRNAPTIKRFNIIRQLFTRMPTSEDRIRYLVRAEAYIEESKNKGLTELDEETPIYMLDYLVHRMYSHDLSYIGKFDEAWNHLQKADSIATAYKMVRAESELNEAYWSFYYHKGEYSKALPTLNKVIENARNRSNIQLLYRRLDIKADILHKLGQPEEAYLLARELLQMKDSLDQSHFHQTLANVRTEFEVERLELEKQHMEQTAKTTRLRMTILIAGCLLLIVIIFGLIHMIRVIQRNRKELKEAKEKAEEADQLKSAFLANMNHEIRTPLNAIVGFSQVLIEEEDKDSRREFAGIIESNNEHLQRLIADVLDISKIESNSMSLIYTDQDMEVVMKEIYNVMLLRIPEGIILKLDETKPYILRTDRNRLIQILTNLLGNAIKHTSEGYIRFGYKLEETDILFYVEDTGEGMEEKQLESIFDRFVQLENGKRGVGLGLAISKGLVTKMGGSIWATSSLGRGSTFYVRIPKTKPVKK